MDGVVILPSRGYLMIWKHFSHYNLSGELTYWHLTESRDTPEYLVNHRIPTPTPTTKNYPDQTVNSSGTERSFMKVKSIGQNLTNLKLLVGKAWAIANILK